jgi:hypothetical protein
MIYIVKFDGCLLDRAGLACITRSSLADAHPSLCLTQDIGSLFR